MLGKEGAINLILTISASSDHPIEVLLFSELSVIIGHELIYCVFNGRPHRLHDGPHRPVGAEAARISGRASGVSSAPSFCRFPCGCGGWSHLRLRHGLGEFAPRLRFRVAKVNLLGNIIVPGRIAEMGLCRRGGVGAYHSHGRRVVAALLRVVDLRKEL